MFCLCNPLIWLHWLGYPCFLCKFLYALWILRNLIFHVRNTMCFNSAWHLRLFTWSSNESDSLWHFDFDWVFDIRNDSCWCIVSIDIILSWNYLNYIGFYPFDLDDNSRESILKLLLKIFDYIESLLYWLIVHPIQLLVIQSPPMVTNMAKINLPCFSVNLIFLLVRLIY